jgi:signal peptidase II
MLRAGLALVLGGATGNVYDRVIRGGVTDFLEFYFGSYVFPTFNVADSAITIGAGLLLLDMWRGRHRQDEKHVSQTD